MDTKVFTSPAYLKEAEKTAAKEKELIRLIQVKSEKLCNAHLIEHEHTQLSHLTKEQQVGALALPKGIILNKLISFLQKL